RISGKTKIEEVRIADPEWSNAHLQVLSHSYCKASFFDEVASWLFPLFNEVTREPLLTVVNEHLLRGIALRVGIKTRFLRASDLNGGISDIGRSERIIALCKAVGATNYLTGPAAKTYLDED